MAKLIKGNFIGFMGYLHGKAVENILEVPSLCDQLSEDEQTTVNQFFDTPEDFETLDLLGTASVKLEWLIRLLSRFNIAAKVKVGNKIINVADLDSIEQMRISMRDQFIQMGDRNTRLILKEKYPAISISALTGGTMEVDNPKRAGALLTLCAYSEYNDRGRTPIIFPDGKRRA